AEKAGEEMLPDQPTVPRGWLTPEEHEFVAGEPLFILQHPAGDPLRVAFDRVVRVPQGAQSTRITYRTNTKRGSSGSPCFTINWGLVALHHGFDEDDPEHPNEGIPFAAMLGQVQAALGT
ncbi:MAG TPA: trypsin-like peptidase domain-containing protein, partial [Chloroflexia bacterium]|nr:trypsin-like peptidase domain-containing protein [Chloroflexia bacterium]